MNTKPKLGPLQIWNMCFGFLGIQIGFDLQNGNVSRIFQTLGAEIDALPLKPETRRAWIHDNAARFLGLDAA